MLFQLLGISVKAMNVVSFTVVMEEVMACYKAMEVLGFEDA